MLQIVDECMRQIYNTVKSAQSSPNQNDEQTVTTLLNVIYAQAHTHAHSVRGYAAGTHRGTHGVHTFSQLHTIAAYTRDLLVSTSSGGTDVSSVRALQVLVVTRVMHVLRACAAWHTVPESAIVDTLLSAVLEFVKVGL
jgi:hypothetical protein